MPQEEQSLHRIRHRRIAALVACSGALLAGCGGSSHPAAHRAAAPPADATSKADVIKGWVDALRADHVEAASSYFGLPVIVENGTPPIELTRRSQVRQFNAALPCGARLLRTVEAGRYTVATFRLTDRPGGNCSSGKGQEAATAFAFRNGKIVEWRRVPLPVAPRKPSPQQPRPGTRSA